MVMFKAASLKLGLDYAIMHNLQLDRSDSTTAAHGTLTTTKKKGERQLDSNETMERARAEHASSMSKKELENLLKYGAYDIFREEQDGRGDEESRRFYEDDIDKILQVRVYQNSFVKFEAKN